MPHTGNVDSDISGWGVAVGAGVLVGTGVEGAGSSVAATTVPKDVVRENV